VVRSRSGRSVTATRSALARHVGPPRSVPPPLPSADGPVAPPGEDDRDTQVLVRPAAAMQPPAPQVVPPAPRVTSTAVVASTAVVTSPAVVEESGPAGPGARPSPLAAMAGAALAVCLVVLGLSALLWAQPGPPPPAEPVGIAAAEQAAGTVDPTGEGPAAAPAAPTAPPPPAPPPAPPAAPSPSPAAPALAPVTVLNNSRIDGLAARAAARFEAAGWPVAATGNYRGRLARTTVFHEPGQEAAARRFAARFPGVVRVLPRTATLPGSGLTVVLTRDFR